MALLKPDTKTVFLCGACLDSAPWAGGHLVGHPGFDGICDWCGRLAQQVVSEGVNDPQVAAYGPFEWSSSLTIEPYRPFVWDVNCYYRDLGVPTDATRREIREAYQRLGGQDDERLTYIVKVLLDPEQRAIYDAIQPGDFLFDQYLRAVVQQRVLDDSFEWTEPTEAEIEEHLRTLKEDLDRRMNRPVSEGPVDKDALSRETPLHRSAWGYYVWKMGGDHQHRMARWRCALALAMRDQGAVVNLRVGIARGLDAPWVILPIGHRPVAFLGEGEQPTRELAHAVIRFLTQPPTG